MPLLRLSDKNLTPVEVLFTLSAVALAFLGYGIAGYRRGKATLRWRPVPGKITWSMMEEREHRHGRRRLLGGITTTQYRPDIKYRYTVGNLEYESTRVHLGPERWHEFRATAQPLLDKYPAGRDLRVFHNPANPAEAVLERGQVGFAMRWIIVGTLLAILVLVLLATSFLT